jgi:TonB family protein
MKHSARIGGSRGGGGFDFGRVFLIVIGIHLLFGLGLLWMAKTSTGQQFAKTYNIKLFQPEKPPEPETAEKPPPPPPPPPMEAPKVETPQVASAAPAAAAAASIGGGAPGSSWSGKFAGESFDGPEGAFHAGVTRVFREAYRDPETDFGPATLELTVSGTGAVQSFRLTQSSGDSANDQAILTAARTVQERGLPAPPDNRARAVTVNLYPR